MIKRFFKFYIIMLRIASLIFVFGMPYVTISQYAEPWDNSICTREAHAATHFFVVFGYSWNSSSGFSRQTLLLVPKVWTSPKAVEISTDPEQIDVRSGYLLLVIAIFIVAVGMHTIVLVLRKLVPQTSGYLGRKTPAD